MVWNRVIPTSFSWSIIYLFSWKLICRAMLNNSVKTEKKYIKWFNILKSGRNDSRSSISNLSGWKRTWKIQSWPGIEPWSMRWSDATLYPLSQSSQLETRPLWVRDIPDGGNCMNENIWNNSYFELRINIRKWKWSSQLNEQPKRLKNNQIFIISTIGYVTNSQWSALQSVASGHRRDAGFDSRSSLTVLFQALRLFF